jgi:hypothetical protein
MEGGSTVEFDSVFWYLEDLGMMSYFLYFEIFFDE